MKLSELIESCQEDIRAALKEKDSVQRDILIDGIMKEFKEKVIKLFGDITDESDSPKRITDYRNDFARLYDQMEKEHGSVQYVTLHHGSMVNFGDAQIHKTIECTIKFS
jgi:hypothetical protein